MNAPSHTSPASRKGMILEQATHLFASQGYNGTPVRAIARACGVTEAAIYRHYENKEHLYAEVVRTKAAEHDIGEQLDVLGSTGTVEEMLTGVAEYILGFATSDPELLQLMASCCRANDQAAAVLFREVRMPIIEFIRSELDRRIAAGEVRPVDTLITARCFVGMVMDCAMCVGVWTKLNATTLRSRDVVGNNVPIFARGLSVGPSPEAAQPGSMT
ncbi:TetR/AcrR family transcriptional regulator [bacterium]|nr:TetR/AcrR family transcriptional regulator [bacterium]